MSHEILARDIFILICVKAEKQQGAQGWVGDLHVFSFTIKAEKAH